MVRLRKPVKAWLKRVFGDETINQMQEVAEEETGREGEFVFGTRYTVQDYEDDLTHHEQKMKEAEDRFEHFNHIRNDYLEQAQSASNLTRKRYLAKARQKRKQAFKYVKLFVAHLGKFEKKLDELTAHETKAISADENTNVDLDETAEAVNESLVGNTDEMDSVEREEADKAVERELSKHSLDDKVSHEEEALRQMEEENVSAEDVGLNADVDEFLEDELGGQNGTSGKSEDDDEEDQIELEW